MSKEKILITGANGQIGTVLAKHLRDVHGINAVIASDLQTPKKSLIGIFEKIDVLNKERITKVIQQYEITQIFHLAAILSAKGEANPMATWDVNMKGLFNILEAAKETTVQKIYFPSSIAVFGIHSPQSNTPQFTNLHPQTMYGVTKQAGENICGYYAQRYGMDIRSLRYPGLISYQSLPGGGTTDYAVDIFHKAVKGETYVCYLREDTRLPMMYMDDAIRATLELMEAPKEQISIAYGYNVQACSFTPAEIAAEIKKHLPDFDIIYDVDPMRQAIADSWVESMDDNLARKDWGWKESFDLPLMVAEMIKYLQLPKEKKKASYNETEFL